MSNNSNQQQSINNLNQNISDDALLKLSVKDLNRLLKSLTPDERNKLKKRRLSINTFKVIGKDLYYDKYYLNY